MTRLQTLMRQSPLPDNHKRRARLYVRQHGFEAELAETQPCLSRTNEPSVHGSRQRLDGIAVLFPAGLLRARVAKIDDRITPIQDVSSFNRTFRQQMGDTPGAIRAARAKISQDQ
jgi:hypothetical protein